MSEIRKQVTIDLNEYGGSGTITLEELSVSRDRAMKNNIGSCTITNLKTQEAYVKIGDQEIYVRLAYIVKAPFATSPSQLTIDNYMAFMDRLPNGGAKLCVRIDEEIRNFRAMKESGENPLSRLDTETTS